METKLVQSKRRLEKMLIMELFINGDRITDLDYIVGAESTFRRCIYCVKDIVVRKISISRVQIIKNKE